MSYYKRIGALMGIDGLMIGFSIWLSYYLRFDGQIPVSYLDQCIGFSLISIIVCIGFMYSSGLYNRVWQYAGIGEAVSICKAVLISSVLSYGLTFLLLELLIPFSIAARAFETNLLVIGGIRFGLRCYTSSLYKQRSHQRKALIIGAGSCGTLVVTNLTHNRESKMYPVGFIDDDPQKTKLQVCGLPVLGTRNEILHIVEQANIQDIIIAMPSVSRKTISDIIGICKQTKAHLRIMPKYNDLIHGKVTFNQIRDVQVEDLLGREPITVDLQGIANYVEDKTVLVTGAGGSIGTELCRQIAVFHPNRLILLGHGENSIYSIEMEMKRLFPELLLEAVIADVQDEKRINGVFAEYRPEVVFHTAAHKHVPLMERNPAEAVKNNVFGTKNVAEAADRHGSERFVLISSDKAVNPTSIMGTTKRIAEMLVQALDKTSRTKFVAVRFGNVLGSRGSVIPRFKEQIASGGPVTVTHPDMIRYFMTIPEAAQLVIQAGAYAKGGEIFILDMGSPVSIRQLAEDLIRFSGFEPYVDIDIEFTGIRPGEKLYEELLTSEEGLSSTKHNRIFISKPMAGRAHLEDDICSIEHVLSESRELLADKLKHVVPTYLNVS